MITNTELLAKELRQEAANGNLQKVEQLLLNKNININAISSNGNTALHWAVERYSSAIDDNLRKKYFHIVELLLEADADTTILNKQDQSAEDLTKDKIVMDLIAVNEARRLRQVAANGELPKVRRLLLRENKFVNINGVSKNGNTALHWAIQKHHSTHDEVLRKEYFEIIQLLLAAGTDVTLLNKDKQTAQDCVEDKSVKALFERHSDALALKTKMNFDFYDSAVAIRAKHTYALQREVLLKYLETFDYFKLLIELKPKTIRVLSLACGTAREVEVLRDYFEKFQISVDYVGIDINSNQIQENGQVFKEFSAVEFVCADVRDEDKLLSFMEPKSFDIVMVRNPDIINMPHVFEPIFTRIGPIFGKKDSILWTTFYHPQEREVMRRPEIRQYYLFGRYSGVDIVGKNGSREVGPALVLADGGTCATDSYGLVGNLQKNIEIEKKFMPSQKGPH